MKNWTVAANSYQVDMPEIYQIELTNQCNLACPACIRDDSRVRRPIGYVNPELIEKMINRGDFEGSYFVELQMYGESLLHPQFNRIVGLLKGHGIKIGMSTNGTLLDTRPFDMHLLDYLTISIDSPDRSTYERLRPGAYFDRLVSAINKLQAEGKPKIDLQVIRFKDIGSELPGLIQLSKEMNWHNVICREVPDGFRAYTSDSWPRHMTNTVCLNPWLSVSVQWDGDCVSCCFEAGKHNVYGNLYQHSLKEIWQSSEVRKNLMENMRLNYNKENPPCKFCYMRSPTLFHTRMLMEEIKKGE